MASRRKGRLPLMAGNWKSHLNHNEAVVHVQRLAWTLRDKKHDPERSEVTVIVPFTDLRSVQTLVDGDRLPVRYGAQDVSAHDGGAHTGEIAASSWPGTPSGARSTARTTPWSTPRRSGCWRPA